MFNKFKALGFAAALALAPVAAHAVPVMVSSDIDLSQSGYSFSATVPVANEGAVFTFTALERLRISGFSLSGTGTSGGTDIASAQWQIVNPNTGPSPFQNFSGGFGVAGGSATALGSIYNVGDVFSVIFTEAASRPMSFTVSFPVAAIPVPAAGLLLLTALGGFAAMRRRKSAATAA